MIVSAAAPPSLPPSGGRTEFPGRDRKTTLEDVEIPVLGSALALALRRRGFPPCRPRRRHFLLLRTLKKALKGEKFSLSKFRTCFLQSNPTTGRDPEARLIQLLEILPKPRLTATDAGNGELFPSGKLLEPNRPDPNRRSRCSFVS